MITPELLAKPGKESDHQKALFCWASQHTHFPSANYNTANYCNFHSCVRNICPTYPELEFLFAIPNGGLRSKITASRMKAEGVRKGVLDVMLPVAKWLYQANNNPVHHAGLFIEMKIKGNKESEDQVKWHTFLVAQGYECIVCYSWIEAVSAIERYLKG